MNGIGINNIRVGDKVRHTTFGEGLVTKCESAPGDVIVTIAFGNNNEAKRFLLSHTPMEKIGECKDPPEKIVDGPNGAQRVATQRAKEHKAYTTEFKKEAVKRALSEGRVVVRKYYGLKETTLRSWIKKFTKGTTQ